MTGTSRIGSPAGDVRPAPLLVRKMKNRLPEVKLDAVFPQICQLEEFAVAQASLESSHLTLAQMFGKQRQRPLFGERGGLRIEACSMIAIEAMVRWVNEHLNTGLR